MSKIQKFKGQNKSVTVNQNICLGCGVCAAICSDVFIIDNESGKATTIEGADLTLPCIKEAEAACPVTAITVL